MIRTLRFALLLACCSTALAQPLYKWIEADGTITFSPEKPEKGIDFQVIDVEKSTKTSSIATGESSGITIGDADSLGSTDSSQTPRITQISFNAAEHELNKDSFKADQVNSMGSNAGQQASLASIMRQQDEQSSQTSGFDSEIVQKHNECEDLRKRVVSLERRLKSTLTPEDMDNTIVKMSEYQRSHDKNCVQ